MESILIARAKKNWMYISGCLSLSSGIAVRQLAHGNASDFVAGALMGAAIVLLVAALGKPSPCSSN
jgi:hypothetical protein